MKLLKDSHAWCERDLEEKQIKDKIKTRRIQKRFYENRLIETAKLLKRATWDSTKSASRRTIFAIDVKFPEKRFFVLL